MPGDPAQNVLMYSCSRSGLPWVISVTARPPSRPPVAGRSRFFTCLLTQMAIPDARGDLS